MLAEERLGPLSVFGTETMMRFLWIAMGILWLGRSLEAQPVGISMGVVELKDPTYGSQVGKGWKPRAELTSLLDCDQNWLGRFTVTNAGATPEMVYFYERSLLTTRLDFRFPDEPKWYSSSYGLSLKDWSLTFHRKWLVPPGSHEVYFQFQCQTFGRFDLNFAKEWDYKTFSVQSTAAKLGILSAGTFIMLYLGALYFYTRAPVHRYYMLQTGSAVAMFFSIFFLIHYDSYVPLMDWLPKHLITFILIYAHIVFRASYFLYLIKSRFKETSLFERFVITSALLSPITLLFGIDFAVRMILGAPFLMLGVISFTARRGMYIETVSNVFYLMGILSILSYLIGWHDSVFWGIHGIGISLIVEMLILYVEISKSSIEFKKKVNQAKQVRERQRQNHEMATVVQDRLMFLDEKNLDIAVHYQSADHVGGDWYFGFANDDRSYQYLFLGDVSGHGVKAALLTSQVAGCIDTFKEMAASGGHPREILRQIALILNGLVYDLNRELELAMSLVAVCIESDSGETLVMNCGHPHVYQVSEQGMSAVSTRGSLLGILPKIRLDVSTVQLAPQDNLIVYTDGLFENTNQKGKTIRLRALRKILSGPQSPREILDQIEALMTSFWQGHPADDDVSVLVLRNLASQTEEFPDSEHIEAS